MIGLEAENIRVAFRMDLPANSKEIYVLNMLDNILSNGKTGLIDLNLNQQQKVYSASGFAYVLCDNSSYILTGKPKTGQTLDEVKDLLLAQIELVKQGSFSDDIMTASINNLRLSEMRQLESNQARAMMMANAFMNNIPWNDACKSIEYYSKITKQDVIDFAKKHFNNNYVVVYKRQGTPDDVEKVNKPAITPIHVNRDAESEFFKKIKNNKVKSIEPVFVDFQKEITFLNYNNVPVLYVQNKENKIFTITFRYKVGELNDLRFPIATDYFDYLGTSKYSAEELKEEFYKLACNLTIRSHDNNSNIVISGLSDNFEKALSLAMELLTDAQPNKVALENLVSDLLKQRNDAKSNQQAILNALRSYSEYGPELSKYALSETQLNALTDEELIKVVQQYLTYKPEILYYGPEDTKTLLNIIGKVYKTPKTFATPQPKKLFEPLLVTQNSVFFAPYEAKQARLVTYNRGNKFNKDLNSIIMMYNQYFGGGMNAIVFQEMREKRSLAYTAQSRYVTPAEKDEYMYNFSFIATQNDKIVDAFTAFNELFNDMPHSQTAFQLAKEGAKTAIETNRITKAPILYTYIGNRELGYDYDYRKDFYNAIDKFTLKDLVEFNHLYIKDKPKTYMILSKEDDVDFKTVEEKFGKVTKLTLEQIFGY
ncbi:MAG: insulinase family protein [Bacteroidales bacterium]